MTPALFAEAVLIAQGIHEQSWDVEHARYNHDFARSARLACDECKIDYAWAQPIELLNQLAWNDIQTWALQR